ncbi:MAG TPA: glycerophosphodiester phosphodiesterase [Acidimicrobiales bacterium]|nr:glycerophosphodiester phosphodiesterase [Acidimicrobiales bacterium]
MTVTIGHRGDPVNHWGNTLEAFKSAASLGADMVELDCQLTSDGHVVVLHDDTLKKPWGVPKRIGALPWEQVSAIRRFDYRIPGLAEVFSAIQLPVMVDVPNVEVLEAAFNVAVGANALDRCVFAGDIRALVRLRQLSRSARIALSWDKRRLPSRELLARTKPEWFNPHWRLLAPDAVEHMHAAGIGVSVWTVDRPSAMRRVVRAGVDAVITNHTARFLSFLRKARHA